MIKFLKSIECLYASIVASGATTVVFDGSELIGGHEYIRFNTTLSADMVTINRVYIDGHKLDKYVKHNHIKHHHRDFVEITLIIPAEIQDYAGNIKQTRIAEKAFKWLLSPTDLRLKLQFTTKNNKGVRFPENCSELFAESPSIAEIDLSGVDVSSNITSTERMFYDCCGLEKVKFGIFNVATLTNMAAMFKYCGNLREIDLKNFNTLRVTNMAYIFGNCYSLTDLNLSHFDTSFVTNMDGMFAGCRNLVNLDLSNFNTSNVTDMSYMFYGCKSLNTVNLSSEHYSMDFVNTLMKYCDFLTINFL